MPSAVATLCARQRWFEVGLVLLVACSASIIGSIYTLKTGQSTMSLASNSPWAYGILHETTSLLFLRYVLSRRGLSFRDLGLRWTFRDAGMGVLVAALSYVTYFFGSILVSMFQYWHYHASFNLAHTGRHFIGHPSMAFIPFCFVNPFFEELIVRAYLMTEIADLTKSSILAVTISVAVQFSYHLYYGWAGACSLAFLFLTFALYYSRSRRALPIVIAHGIYDVTALFKAL
jgi:membrane protease YdiL (CAAX protease family)